MDVDDKFAFFGHVNGDPPPPSSSPPPPPSPSSSSSPPPLPSPSPSSSPPPSPPPPSHPTVPDGVEAAHPDEQPTPSLAPQRQEVGPLDNQAAFYSAGQVRYEEEDQPVVHHVPNAAATAHPAAPPQPDNNVTAPRIVTFLGYLPDGSVVYTCSAPSTEMTKVVRQHHGGPYVKKPLNAYMLFSRDQRPNYAAQINTSGSAGINVILGQKWKSLSHEERAVFYNQADQEKRLHAQRHPGWTCADNFGVKRRWSRSKAAKLAEAREVTQQATELTDDMPAPPDMESGNKANEEVESDLQPSDFCSYGQGPPGRCVGYPYPSFSLYAPSPLCHFPSMSLSPPLLGDIVDQ